MGKEGFIHPLDKPLQLLYDSQHKENLFFFMFRRILHTYI